MLPIVGVSRAMSPTIVSIAMLPDDVFTTMLRKSFPDDHVTQSCVLVWFYDNVASKLLINNDAYR